MGGPPVMGGPDILLLVSKSKPEISMPLRCDVPGVPGTEVDGVPIRLPPIPVKEVEPPIPGEGTLPGTSQGTESKPPPIRAPSPVELISPPPPNTDSWPGVGPDDESMPILER
jgi:hypothetical protein